jgi:hypothetical protein
MIISLPIKGGIFPSEIKQILSFLPKSSLLGIIFSLKSKNNLEGG